jgi:hypothetical protein
VRNFAERYVPERFLPEFIAAAPGDYSPVSLVGEDIEDDGKQNQIEIIVLTVPS